jgi:hypothetical protein
VLQITLNGDFIDKKKLIAVPNIVMEEKEVTEACVLFDVV